VREEEEEGGGRGYPTPDGQTRATICGNMGNGYFGSEQVSKRDLLNTVMNTEFA
jgi:hypothetical protein